MTPGEALMLLWYVDSWDTQQKVPLFIATAEEVHFGFQILCLCQYIDAVAFTNVHFGSGTGPIHLDNVGCSGGESNLTDCPRSFTVSCYRHYDDAGVRCQGKVVTAATQ